MCGKQIRTIKIWFSRICREEVQIWGCERAAARSHPQIWVLTTEIPEEPKILIW